MLKFELWLYGTRTVKSKKKNASKKVTLSRIPAGQWSKAKGFHLFYKKPRGKKFIRFTDEIELFSARLSAFEKKSQIEFLKELISEQMGVPVRTVELPDYVPEKSNQGMRKKDFIPRFRLIVMDELAARGEDWTDERVERFVQKLWRAHKNNAHLVDDEFLKRSLVIQELDLKDNKEYVKERKKAAADFKKKMEKRDINMTADSDVKVEVRTKEVFRRYREGEIDPEFIRKFSREERKLVMTDRQKTFVQVVADYKENMFVDKSDLQTPNKFMARAVRDTVKNDARKLFNDAFDKGIFDEDNEDEFAIRLFAPIVDDEGFIPTTYKKVKGTTSGNATTGFGYSTPREVIKNRKDIDRLIDNLFQDFVKDMYKYVINNNAMGFMISGFIIERLVK